MAQIAGLLNAGQADSTQALVTDVVDVDSMIGDVNTYFGLLQDPYSTLKGSFIFIAETPHWDGYKDVVGVFKDGQILWDSGQIIEGALERIFGTMDLTNSGKVDIIATGLAGATGATSHMWIFSWDGEKGTPINPYDEFGSGIVGNRGSFDIEDVNGDGKYVITCQLDTADVEYAWNGTTFQTITNPPVLSNNTFSPANNFSMRMSAKVERKSEGYAYEYTVTNLPSSAQSINNVMITAPLDSIKEYAPENWSPLGVKDVNLARFVVLYGLTGILSPGKSLGGFKIVSTCLPGISKYYTQAPHTFPNFAPENYPAIQPEFINDFLTNSVRGFTIAPVKLPLPFVPSNFLDTLISYKDQATSLGWIDNGGIANSLDSKLENAKNRLAAGDTTAAKNMLSAFVNEVEAQNGKHLTSEAYALLKFNAEYLINRLP